MRLASFLTLVCFVCAACAHNPARPITVTDEEVKVHEGEDVAFTRGDDKLDEQEFYASIGDTKSFDAVKSSRSTGALLQGTGVALAVLGFAIALAGLGAYFLSDDSKFSPPPIPVPEDLRSYTVYGAIGGGVLGALGVGLTAAMGPKVRGDTLIFGMDHARHALEVSYYGENGATPDDIKSLTFGAGDEGKTLCAAGDLTLAPLVARDAKGRVMRVSERADWFKWETTPKPGLVSMAPDAPVLSSPLSSDFEHVDATVGLTVQIAETQVGHTMSFEQSFACSAGISRSGRSGNSGERGKHGASGTSSTWNGGSGTDGTDGVAGGDGQDVVAEVAWVTTPKRGRLALLVVDGEARLFDPSQTRASVTSAGGEGGRGGDGGSGGTGHSGSGGKCEAGGSGGSGGRGGRGGTGGRGGRVEIRAADRALLDAVEGDAPGGSGGRPGSAGGAGSGGSGSSCKGSGWAKNGGKGTPGSSGAPGQDGTSGSVKKTLVGGGDLSMVARVLAANPTLTLEGGGAYAGPAPKPRKRK